MPVDLKKITKGKVKTPPRVLVWGADGVGKTTFAAGAPQPFFIDANKGSGRLDVARVETSTWEETVEWIDAVVADQVDCKTLVLDSITDLEAFGHAHLFPSSSITKFEGGYGKGDDVATGEWRKILFKLEKVTASGRGVIIVAHSRVKTFNDPTGPAYDRFEVGCRPALAGQLRQWCDYVLFCREEVIRTKQATGKETASTAGVRWAYTHRTPAYDAKARGSLIFPDRILLSWQDFAQAIARDEMLTSDTDRQVGEMLAEIGDPEFERTVREYIKNYPKQLVSAHNRVAARLDEVRSRNATQGEVK